MARSDDEKHPPSSPRATLDQFREAFHKERLSQIRDFGFEVPAMGHVLYRCANTGRNVVVRDMWLGRPAGPADAFVARLTRDWWQGRQAFSGEKQEEGLDLRPVAGLYGCYLTEVGFDYSVEFSAAPAAAEETGGVICAWRMDGRGRAVQLHLPANEGMFRDQTGTFFDTRAGWRWLVEQHAESGRLVVAELQAGYVMGVRPGVPGDPDPASREDADLEAAFSRMDAARFDTLEFLGGPEATKYPFVGELYGEWLGSAAAAVEAGTLELFVLADSSEFLSTIEDMAKHRGIAVEWIDPEEDIRVALHAGPLRMEMAFAYPWLRTLHTGRSMVEGVADFYQPMAVALESAHELYRVLEAHFADSEYRLDVEDGVVVVVRRQGSDLPVARGSLVDMVGRNVEHGSSAEALAFDALGYDPETNSFGNRTLQLDRCPLCGDEARVGKVVRPKVLLGVDPRTLAGIEIGEHVVYYTVECPLHVTPIDPTPGVGLSDLEAAYRKGLNRAADQALVVRELPEAADALLLIGAEFGSLVLEPARIRAAFEALGERSPGKRYAYAFFRDALVVAREPLAGGALRAARLAALEALQNAQMLQTWPLDVARPVDLDVPPAGSFQLEP